MPVFGILKRGYLIFNGIDLSLSNVSDVRIGRQSFRESYYMV